MANTADELVSEVRLNAVLPDSEADDKLTDLNILTLADREIRRQWIPFISEKRSGYNVTSETFTLTGNTLRIPKRAVGASLIDLTAVDTDGNAVYSIPEVTIASREYYNAGELYDASVVYSIEGDKIHFHPSPPSENRIKLHYQWRPGNLVLTTNTAEVMEITGVSGGVLSGNAPSSWTTSTKLDVVQASPNFDLLLNETSPSAVSAGSSVTFASSVTDVAVGDYVTAYGKTPIVHVPEEVFPLVVTSVVIRVLMLFGEGEQLVTELSLLAQDKQQVSELMAPRNKGERRKAVNRHGFMRGGRGRRW